MRWVRSKWYHTSLQGDRIPAWDHLMLLQYKQMNSVTLCTKALGKYKCNICIPAASLSGMWFFWGSLGSVSRLLQCCISLRHWVGWWWWDLGSCGCVDTSGQSYTGQRKLQGKLLWAKGGGGESALSSWPHCHAKELQRAVCVHTIIGVITWFWSHYHFSGNEMGLAFVLCRLIKDLS